MASVTRFLAGREAQTDGKPAEERGDAALGAEVSGLPFYMASAAQSADRAAGIGPVPGKSSGTDEPGPRDEYRTHGRGVIPLSAGLAGLFRAVSSAIGVARSCGVDQAPASVGALEASRVRFTELRRQCGGESLPRQRCAVPMALGESPTPRLLRWR